MKKKKYNYPDGNVGSTKDIQRIKKIYGQVILNKNAEINYLKKQYKATIVRMQKVLTAYKGSNARDQLPGGNDMKYCACCGQMLKEEKENAKRDRNRVK